MNLAEITILLVDDDEMIRECITSYLEDEGFSVRCAVSGEEALAVIDAVCPTVCISDMRLPGMDGEAFIGKAHLICPETGFILHTGLAYVLSDELRKIGMTADDVLIKPVHELSILIDRIRAIALARETRDAKA